MQGRPLTEEQRERVFDVKLDGYSDREVARQVGVSRQSVARVLEGTTGVEELSDFQRAKFLGGWQYLYLHGLTQLRELPEPTTLKDHRDVAAARRDIAVALGISTEKALLLTGQPTEIIAQVHTLRAHLPELIGKLVEVAKRLDGVQPPQIVGSSSPAEPVTSSARSR